MGQLFREIEPMAIKTRLRSIENRVGAAPCECQSAGWDGKIGLVKLERGQTELPPEVCPKCGRVKKIVIIARLQEGLWAELNAGL